MPDTNLNIKKHSHCQNSGNSNHVETKMDLDIDSRCLPGSNNASRILETNQMSQCRRGVSKGDVPRSTLALLTIRQLYSVCNRSVDNLVISYHDMIASRLSSLKLHHLLQEGISTTSPVSLLRGSALIPSMSLIVLFLTLAISCSGTQAQSTGLCQGVPCANGGRLMVDNSVWGHCRCRCPSGFVGPYCQYTLTPGKRSAVSTLRSGRRRTTRSQRLAEIQQQLLNLTPEVISSSNSEPGHLDSMASAGVMDDSRIISRILEAQNSIDDSYKYDSISDRLWLLKNIRR